MSYLVLARKWRPKRFDDVVGQPHITRSLINAIKQHKVGHAYLLTGTRGIGKTSIARIFAKALRCESLQPDGNPCLKCESCLSIDQDGAMDFVEIDGASNNSVDNIRTLVDNVQYLPTSGRYKVYVIDEVHMLSTSAFNALLKTLEEPPPHAVFIFATTDPEKVIGTVLSRCQRFDFRHVSIDDLLLHLKKIAQVEGIRVESDQLLKQICIQGKGSVRDTLSLLDQVLSYSEGNVITEDTLIQSLGVARLSAVRDMISSILKGDVRRCSSVYRELIHENIDPKAIAHAVLDGFFDVIESIDSPSKAVADGLIYPDDLDEVSSAELYWVYETLARDLSFSLRSISPEKVSDIVFQKTALRRMFLSSKSEKIGRVSTTTSVAAVPVAPKIAPVPTSASVPVAAPIQSQNWDGFLAYLYGKNPASASNLEQGNILTPVDPAETPLRVRIGFPKSAQIFLDHLKEKGPQDKILAGLSEYFKRPLSDIQLELVLVDQMVTRADIAQKADEEKLEDRRQRVANHPTVKEAESVFGAKVDRVILNDPSSKF